MTLRRAFCAITTSTRGVSLNARDDDLTFDRFLGGKLMICQPKSGHRAGVDPVLLAAATPARPGQSVLELGCGTGVASLCLGARVKGVVLHAVELQPDYADLARQNSKRNAIPIEVTTADLAHLPAEIRAQNYDHVIANPPYYAPNHGTHAQNAGRKMSLTEHTPLRVWLDVAIRRSKPRGHVHVIQRADRLQDVLVALDDRVGDIRVCPLAPRVGRAAELILVHARKGARGPMTLCAPVILHKGQKHDRDGESYSPQIRAVLREGAALEFQ